MASDNNNAAPAPNNVDQIRDIIFGGQMRDYDQRFRTFEERLTREVHELTDKLEDRVGVLGERGKERFEALASQLKMEKAERVESDRDLVRELKELTKTVERGMAQLQSQTEKLQKELLSHVAEQAKQLREAARAERDELAAALEQHVSELQDSKTDRATLAQLLTEMAARISGEESSANSDK